MSEAQMKSTAKLMRNVCQPKSKVTNGIQNIKPNYEYINIFKY